MGNYIFQTVKWITSFENKPTLVNFHNFYKKINLYIIWLDFLELDSYIVRLKIAKNIYYEKIKTIFFLSKVEQFC